MKYHIDNDKGENGPKEKKKCKSTKKQYSGTYSRAEIQLQTLLTIKMLKISTYSNSVLNFNITADSCRCIYLFTHSYLHLPFTNMAPFCSLHL